MSKTATEFSPGTAYGVDDLCLYGGELYIFTSGHSGAWNANDVRPYDDYFEQDFNRVINGMDRDIQETRRAGEQPARVNAEIAFVNSQKDFVNTQTEYVSTETEYAGSIDFNSSLIAGTRYRYTFMNPII